VAEESIPLSPLLWQILLEELEVAGFRPVVPAELKQL
jgi:hypothetical protein